MDIEKIKSAITIEQALTQYGIKTNHARRIPCPIHGGKNPTAFAYKERSFFCYSCGTGGDVIELVMQLYKISFTGALRKLNDDFRLGLEDGKPPDKLADILLTTKREMERKQREHDREIYRTVTECYCRLLRAGVSIDALDPIEQWLDTHLFVANR